jgi:hypothetical protein
MPLSNGTGSFLVTLATAGTQTITATDSSTLSITGSATLSVNPAAADHLSLSGLASNTAGTPFDVSVTVQDAYNNTVTGYTGTVHFTSSDASATLPADYAFTAGDQGVHIVAGGVTLFTAGSQTISATDTVSSSIQGSAGVNVAPAPAVSFAVVAPAAVTSGSSFAVTVIALDPFGNTDVNYLGTATFSSSDGRIGDPLGAMESKVLDLIGWPGVRW